MSEIKLNGFTLVVSPVSPLAPKAVELNHKKTHPEPTPPTYTVDAVGGVVEEFPHTHETVETLEEKEALLKYNEEHDAWTADLNYKMMRLFLSQGIDIKLSKKDEKELTEQAEMLGITIPENKKERGLLFLETFVVKRKEDMEKLIQAVLAETGIDEETLAVANATFPD